MHNPSFRSQERRFVGVFAVCVLLGASLALAQVTPIADARLLPLGTVVTVEGSVTVPSGAFAASTFDQGFAIEDSTGGIYVSLQTNLGLNFNRLVQVTGVVDDDGFGLLVIRPADPAAVVTPGGAAHVKAQSFNTGAISEATEGLLVEVSGTVTRITDDLPFGYSIFVDDGSGETQIFIPATTGVNPFAIPYVELGAEIRAAGYSGEFLSQYEVLPRFRGDIHKAN